jgi:hypothetical protein
MIVRREVGALLLLVPLLTSSLPNNVRIGEYTPKSKVIVSLPLKGQCHNFIHESSSPKPLIITLGSFQIFPKFAEIFASQGAPPVPLVSVIPVAKLPPVSRIPAENLLPVSVTLVVNRANNWDNIRQLTPYS